MKINFKIKVPPQLAPVAAKIRVLFYGEEPPPPPPGQRVVRKPVQTKEPVLSRRRLLLGAEAGILCLACLLVLEAWRGLMGNWPSRATFRPPETIEFASIVDMAAENGRLWIVGPKRLALARIDAKEVTIDRRVRGLPSPVVTAIVPDGADEKRTWIATARGLVVHDEDEGVSSVNTPDELEGAHVSALCFDATGRMWVGTTDRGLFEMKDGEWKNHADRIPSPYVTGLAADGGDGVWAGVFTGGLVRTNGKSWEYLGEPKWVKGKSVLKVFPYSGDSIAAVTEEGIRRVTRDPSARPLTMPGMRAKDEIAKLMRYREAGSRTTRTLVLTRRGRLLGPGEGRVVPRGKLDGIAAAGEELFYARAGVVYRRGNPDAPLTDWGGFVRPEDYRPAPADMPGRFDHPRFRSFAGRLGLAALLAALALGTRAFRWRLTGDLHFWRAGTVGLPAISAGCFLVGGLWLVERFGWVRTTANEILWAPIFVVFGVWLFMHWIRVIVHEWKLREDAFWMGVSFVLSLAAIWLWWARVALIPALAACVVGGFFFSRGLTPLGRKARKGSARLGAAVLLIVQIAAFFPPLFFAVFVMDWGRGALSMDGTAPLYRRGDGIDVTHPPRGFTWSPDGMWAAYVDPVGDRSSVALVNGDEPGWNPKMLKVPTPELYPRFSPDSSLLAFCYRTGDDALLELYTVRKGARRWRVRLPGVPAPGRQPCWLKGSEDMLVLTYGREGTHVWKVGVERGDAVKLFTSPRRLSWPVLWQPPGLYGGGELRGRLTCAFGGGEMPGIATVTLSDRRVALVTPEPHGSDPMFVFDPTVEGKAAIKFIKDVRSGTKHRLAAFRDRVHGVFKFFGWHIRLPELWIRLPWREAPRFEEEEFWANYTEVRETLIAGDGRSMACIARHGKGEEHVLHMLKGGSDCRVILRSQGSLQDLRWASFKNRMLVAELTFPQFSPIPVRRVLMLTGLTVGEYTGVSARPMAPFAFWSGTPEFSPDGHRVAFAACDRFWRPRVALAERFAFFEVALEHVSIATDVGASLASGGM